MTTFVIVRHAEKSTDDAKDPSLSEAGRVRAQSLARLLADAPLSAVYATGYRRTQQTAQSSADAHGIKVTTYDAQLPVSAFASQLRVAHAHGTVLVVGHSNTVPEIVAALSGQPVDAMSDDQYDLIYRVRTGSDGKVTLTRDRY
ncbi:MAG TPA: phosphoglycerate mutase family protein [Pseudoxanthomonas sp.]|nr:phosphoglycerate mutase family protein [Pseudoxanthomonas sp.]